MKNNLFGNFNILGCILYCSFKIILKLQLLLLSSSPLYNFHNLTNKEISNLFFNELILKTINPNRFSSLIKTRFWALWTKGKIQSDSSVCVHSSIITIENS